MASEDVFNGVKTMSILLNAYMSAVGQEIGKERALTLFTKTCEGMGTMRGMMTKKQSDSKQFDAKAAWSLLIKGLKDSSGFTVEVLEESPQRVVVRNMRCPFYDAAAMLGMDANAIETICRAGSIRMADAAVKQLNPNLNVRVQKFRSAPDGFCVEEIVEG
ncbi:MAG: L-2-amino-thiazoline-4-carboxylic acid hydrolase [Chloroflexi bacterium]|nr:L-2-amino-thiazoline-4-carboxylic acid hydrolase [Chloroflexota bacterium]